MPATFTPSSVGRLRELTQEIIVEEAALQMFLKLTPDLYCIISPDGHMRRLNEGWERQLGWTKQEYLEHPLVHFMHPDDVPIAQKVLSVAPKDAVRFVARLRLKNTDRFVSYEWNMAACKDGNIYATARENQRTDSE